jgi:antitoxin component YwqK of YwqJK toxin-antitoxin module
MKKSILLLLTLTMSVLSTQAQNATDGKGLRKGEWFIPYTYSGSLPFYDYMNKLLNLDKILIPENETEKEADYRIFEKVSYKKGIKQGEFSIYSAAKNNQGKYPQIAAGEYKDGKIDGNLIFLDYGSQKRLCSAIYENGKIKDQDIVIEESKGGNEGMYGSSNQNFVAFGSEKIYPIIKMKDGVCVEQIVTVLKDFKLLRIVKTDVGFTKYIYGRNMLSGIIDLSYCLEVAELDNNFKTNGIVSIYEETKTPFDTSKLNYRATFKDGKKNGTAYWYDAKTGESMMECNYVDGLLSGVSKFKAASGKTYVEANFKDGLLNGKLTTFYLNDGSFLSLTGPICETKVNKDIYAIVSENANTKTFKETIPMLRKDGPILTEGQFKFFEAQYVNGKLSGKTHYYHSDGKKLYEGTASNCKLSDWYWYDTNGKVIYSKEEEDDLTQQAYDILNNYSQQQSNSNQQQSTTSNNQEIGTCSMSGGWLKVEDVNGRQIYGGNSASGDLKAYSSQIIVTQKDGWTSVYTIRDGNLIQLYSGNSPRGTVVNASGSSFFTKDGSWNCKYNVNNGNCSQEYCKN